MKVTMRASISGTRNGERWPRQGEAIDLPQDEAEHLCAAGLAELAQEERQEDGEPETATAPPAELSRPPVPESAVRPEPEKRGRPRKAE